jgi:hypothetical protein
LASFSFSEDSVGWALQSCIGGDHDGFQVYQLSDRRFRFSVASNKVGNFIYGLRDRVWPDFVCHFTLFSGEHPSITGFHHDNTHWSADSQILELAHRSSMNFCPNLDVLKASAQNDNSFHSELAKFGFLSARTVYSKPSVSQSLQFGSFEPAASPPEFSPPVNSLIFGSFSDPVFLDIQGVNGVNLYLYIYT